MTSLATSLSPSLVPGHADAVPCPTSFDDVRRGIKAGRLDTLDRTVRATREVFDNCESFCGSSSDYGALAQASRDAFDHALGDPTLGNASAAKRRRVEPDRFSDVVTTKTRSLENEQRRLVKALAAALATERIQAEEVAAERRVSEQLQVAAAAAEARQARGTKAPTLLNFFNKLSTATAASPADTTASPTAATAASATAARSSRATAASTATNATTRISKRDRAAVDNMKTLGDVGRNQKRGNVITAANGASSAATDVVDHDEPQVTDQHVTDLVRELVHTLSRTGNLNTVLRVWAKFKERAEVIGLDLIEDAIGEVAGDAPGADVRARYMGKSLYVKTIVLQAIRDFGQALCPDNSHATRTNRHALHTVIAATTPDDPKLYDIYRDLIGISKTQHVHALTLKKSYAEQDTDHWMLNAPIGTRCDRYNDACSEIVAKWLLDFSRISNEDKRPARVFTGVTEDGKAVYDLVSKRVLPCSKVEIPKAFTASDQYPLWLAEATKTIKNPIFGYWRHVHPVLDARYNSKFRTEECVCPHCTVIDRNLPKVHLEHQRWCREHGPEDGPAPDHNWLKSTRQLQNALQCKPKQWHEVSFPSFDTATGWFDFKQEAVPWIHLTLNDVKCSRGQCDQCGFENLYGADGVTVPVGAEADGDEGLAYGCKVHDLDSAHTSQLFQFLPVPDGVSVDKNGKVKQKTRTDFVLSSFERAEYVRMFQDFCRKFTEHMWPVRLRSFMAKRYDFLFHTARAVWYRGVDVAVDTVQDSLLDDLIVETALTAESLAAVVDRIDSNTAASYENGTDGVFTSAPVFHECYAARCPNRGTIQYPTSARRCISAACNRANEVALLVPPQRAWGSHEEVTDFASAVNRVQEVGETGNQGTICNHDIFALHYDASLMATASLDHGSNAYKKRMEAGIHWVPETVCSYVSVLSKHVHNKVFAANSEAIINHFLKFGELPDWCTAAMWVEGKLVQGSADFSKKETQDACKNDVDYYSPAGQGETECPHHDGPYWLFKADDTRGPDRPGRLLKSYVSCDNCPAQYGVCDMHHFIQTSGEDQNGGIPTTHTRFLAHHGKNETDAMNKVIVWFLKKMAQAQTPVQPGAYQLALSFAKARINPGAAYSDPAAMPALSGRWNHVKHHIVMYIPATGFDERLGNNCADDTKIKNSKQFTFIEPHSSGAEATTFHRENTCWCAPCANGRPWHCMATDLCGAVDLEHNYTQLRERSGAAHTRRGGIYSEDRAGEQGREAYWSGLKSKDLVVVRIHPDDRGDVAEDEEFFVAKVTADGAPAYKLAKAGLHQGSYFEKGWFVTQIKWMHLERIEKSGDHLYRYYSKAKPVTYQANGLVCNAGKYINASEPGPAFKYDRILKLYRLKGGTVESIRQYCDLSAQ